MLDLFFYYLVASLVFEPNHVHGIMDYNECGQFLSVVNAMWSGQHLYKDIYLQYGPLHYWVPSAAMAVFGKTLETLRGYFFYGGLATVVLMAYVCRRLIPQRAVAYAAAILIAMESHHPFWSSRWGGWRFFMVAAAMYLLSWSARSPKAKYPALAGVFCALSFLHTYDAGIAAFAGAAAYYAYAVWQTRTDPQAAGSAIPVPRSMMAFAAGAAAVMGVWTLELLRTGALGAYVAELMSIGPRKAFAQPILPGDITAKVLLPGVAYALSLAVLGWASFKRSWIAYRHRAGLVPWLAAGGLLYLFAFRAIRGAQFENVLSFAVFTHLYAAALVYRAALGEGRLLPWPSGRPALKAAAIALIIVSAASWALSYKRFYKGGLQSWLSYQSEKHKSIAYYFGWHAKDGGKYVLSETPAIGKVLLPDWQDREIKDTASAITSMTEPGEGIFCFPDLAIFNFVTDRPQITKYHMIVGASTSEANTREVLENLATARPRVVLLGVQLSALAKATGRQEELLPEVTRYVLDHYRPDRQTGNILIYRRSD